MKDCIQKEIADTSIQALCCVLKKFFGGCKTCISALCWQIETFLLNKVS